MNSKLSIAKSIVVAATLAVGVSGRARIGVAHVG